MRGVPVSVEYDFKQLITDSNELRDYIPLSVLRIYFNSKYKLNFDNKHYSYWLNEEGFIKSKRTLNKNRTTGYLLKFDSLEASRMIIKIKREIYE